MISPTPNPIAGYQEPEIYDFEDISHTHDGINSPLIDASSIPGGISPKTATIVIGPESNADSSTYDYVTDGTADDVQFQAAIDATALLSTHGGGSICIREGSYVVATPINLAADNVTIFGMGKSTVITAHSSLNGSIFNLGSASSSHFNCVIRDIYFDGNQSNATNSECIISNDNVDPIVNVEILDCYFTNSHDAAISNSDANAKPMLIEGNFFENWKDGNPALALGAVDKVHSNYFSTNGTSSSYINTGGSIQPVVIQNDFVMPSSYNATCVDGGGIVSGNTFVFGSSAGSSAKAINAATIVEGNSITFGTSANAASVGINNCTLVGQDNYIKGAGIGITPLSLVSTQFDKTNTTLANVTGLTKPLLAGRYYNFEAVLFINADATGGSKYAISGTASATSIIYEITLTDDSTSAHTITSRQTSLGGNIGQAGTTAGLCVIKGLIKCNAAGSLTVQFAQNAASGTSSVLIGSYFNVEQLT